MDIVPQSWILAKRQTDIEGRERGSAVLGFAGRLERSLSNLSVSVESESGLIL